MSLKGYLLSRAINAFVGESLEMGNPFEGLLFKARFGTVLLLANLPYFPNPTSLSHRWLQKKLS